MPRCKECAHYFIDISDPAYGVCVADTFISETSGEERFSIQGDKVEAKQECMKPEKFIPRSQMARKERLYRGM